MTAVVGRTIPSLSSLVEVLLGGGEAQKSVISRKEKAERIRRGEVTASLDPSQGGRGGVMRNRRPRVHCRVHNT
jgi:hypothetical protein